MAPKSASALEQEREARIASNKRRLAELGLEAARQGLETASSSAKKQRKEPAKTKNKAAAAEPPRRSGRQRREVSYSEPTMTEVLARAPAAVKREPLPDYDPPAETPAAARIQPAFDPSEGRRDSQGRLVFSDHPEFRPNLTPKQVIRAGSFGGIYFNPTGGKPGILGKRVEVSHEEFPDEWFAGLPKKQYAARIYTFSTNKYGERITVKAGQDQAFWEDKGWIDKQDPRGWFQWYCRFYQGRRTADDARQISRWKGVVGDKGRWVRALCNKIVATNKRWDDASVSPVIRQTLLHWAFELTADEFDRMRRQL